MKRYTMTLLSFVFIGLLYGQTDDEKVWKEELLKAKTLLKEQPAQAEESIQTLLKGKNKNNPQLLVEIGRTYLAVGNTEKAIHYAELAKEEDAKYAAAYLLSGDIALAGGEVSQASSDYSQAIYFDENYLEAYLRYAELYQKVNPTLAMETLEKVEAKQGNNRTVALKVADLYYEMGRFAKAKQVYERFMKEGTPTEEEETQFALLLFLNKEYEASNEVAKKGLEINPKGLVLNRLLLYNNVELKQYEAAQTAAKILFEEQYAEKRSYLDYTYYGHLLKASGEVDKAIEQYNTALFLAGGEHPELALEVAEIYEKKKRYDKAVTAYAEYIESKKEKVESKELFQWGRLNYYAATDSTLQSKQANYLATADSTFRQIADKVPQSYIGSFWRARVNSVKDPETTFGLAKPYYEAALAILLAKPADSNAPLIECYSYLGYYYFVQKEYRTSKEYWTKILQLDPTNAVATKAIQGIK
ncbi:MAG: tetratricopeptide repeat protein [Phocaeicola sp.]